MALSCDYAKPNTLNLHFNKCTINLTNELQLKTQADLEKTRYSILFI